MSTGFAWTAVDTAGHTRSGVVNAVDETAARAELERRSLIPVELAPAGRTPASTAARPGRGRMSGETLALVTRQLATLVTVSPLEEALRTLTLQTEKPALRMVLGNVHTGVLEGYRLSDAMAREPRAFPPLYRAMVAAGEGSGALASIMERLADLLERQAEIRGKVVTALVYPAVLAIVALGVIGVLMAFVVPRVVEQFESLGQQLPLLTRIVIALSEGLRDWGWLMLLLGVAGALAGAAALRRPAVRLRFDGAVLKAPVVGRLTRDLHAARMARTLSIMLASGLPVLEGLAITARTVPNTVLKASTLAMAEAVREGGGLSAAMRRADVFPPILVYMTASGESSGRLETLLDRAADYLEREVRTFSAVMLSFLEPAIIVIMGGLVALIVLSILLPILQINTLTLG
ncbi:type II secretion system inner membrane protein GspF [Brevundimonas sp.]|uniref:type II secretion system inner membrane protein GspF n=1 Tax=Brevundimonas sp. TaxID=1871086 RepID=UPI003919A37D